MVGWGTEKGDTQKKGTVSIIKERECKGLEASNTGVGYQRRRRSLPQSRDRSIQRRILSKKEGETRF